MLKYRISLFAILSLLLPLQASSQLTASLPSISNNFATGSNLVKPQANTTSLIKPSPPLPTPINSQTIRRPNANDILPAPSTIGLYPNPAMPCAPGAYANGYCCPSYGTRSYLPALVSLLPRGQQRSITGKLPNPAQEPGPVYFTRTLNRVPTTTYSDALMNQGTW